MRELRALDVAGPSFNTWAILANCQNLERLHIFFCGDRPVSVNGLAELVPRLRHLHLDYCVGIRCVGPMNLPHLTTLDIYLCNDMRRLDIAALDALTTLKVHRCHSFRTVTRSVGLKSLDFSEFGDLESLNLGASAMLEKVVRECPDLTVLRRSEGQGQVTSCAL